jgi:hypothetical protein
MSESATPTGRPDEQTLHLAYAEASIVLIEALMLLLLERRAVSVEELIDCLETAVDTKHELAKDGSHPRLSMIAVGVLDSIANSIRAAQGKGS